MCDGDDVATDLPRLHEVENLARLAQMSSMFSQARTSRSASTMIGTGSLPVSAMRPANIEIYAGGPARRFVATRSTFASVRSAVTLTLTP
jgi:hypothetical protein